MSEFPHSPLPDLPLLRQRTGRLSGSQTERAPKKAGPGRRAAPGLPGQDTPGLPVLHDHSVPLVSSGQGVPFSARQLAGCVLHLPCFPGGVPLQGPQAGFSTHLSGTLAPPEAPSSPLLHLKVPFSCGPFEMQLRPFDDQAPARVPARLTARQPHAARHRAARLPLTLQPACPARASSVTSD